MYSSMPRPKMFLLLKKLFVVQGIKTNCPSISLRTLSSLSLSSSSSSSPSPSLSSSWPNVPSKIFINKRQLSSTPVKVLNKSGYDLVIIGGGAGGIAIASRFKRYFKVLKKPLNSIAVIEPRDVHYYQPLWTLVGAGIKPLSASGRPMSEVIPDGVDWIKDSCSEIEPESNEIKLSGAGGKLQYKYLVVAAGIQIDWHKIEGLVEALESPDSNVCSNYSEKTVQRTWEILQKFQGGHALFTYPNSPIKCAGAPQKIMYLVDSNLRQRGLRTKSNITYCSTLPRVFACAYYSKTLQKMCDERDLKVKTRTSLVKIDWKQRMAYFENLDKPEQNLIEMKYEMLHVAPPMSAPTFLKCLANETTNGFVAVDPQTLQHVKYSNVFALGDCSSCPTSKTAAAIASQNYILAGNLLEYIKKTEESSSSLGGKNLKFNLHYDGYTSCPIVTGNNRCIMAEFNYKMEPQETFPINQSIPRKSMYFVKKEILPFVYWNGLLKGYWSGPGPFRTLLHLGLK